MLSLPTVTSALLALSFPLSGMAAPMLASNGLTTKDDHSQVDKVNQAIKTLADDLNDTTDSLNKIITTALSNARNDDKRQSIKGIAQSILKDEHDADEQRAILISVTTGNLHSRQSQSTNQQNPGQKNAQPQPSQQAQPKNNIQNTPSQQNQNQPKPSQQSQPSQQDQDALKKVQQQQQQQQEDQKKKQQQQQQQQQQDQQNQQNQKNNNNNNNKPSNTAPTVVVPQVIKPTVVVAPPTTNNDHPTTTNNDHSTSTTTSQDTILSRIQNIINNPDPESSFRTAIAIGLDRNANGLVTDRQLILAALVATGQVGDYADFHTSDTKSTWHS